MPYNNQYNRDIAKQVRGIDQTHINRINQISETNSYDIASPLESMTLRDPTVTGGSGYAAATVQDLGYEATLGATPKKRGRKSKVTGEGMSAGGMSAGGASAGGMAAGGASAGGMSAGGASAGGMSAGTRGRPRVKPTQAPACMVDDLTGGALLTLQDLDKMKGQPPEGKREYITVRAGEGGVNVSKAKGGGTETGGARRTREPNARNHMIRDVMQKHKLTLAAASKYIKEHNLYKK